MLFGPSLIGLRFFAAVALDLVLVLTGLMARHLGGGRQAQIVAPLAAAIDGVAFSAGTLFQYVSFDYLWWAGGCIFHGSPACLRRSLSGLRSVWEC
jgi:hypothetical protein